MTRNPDGSWTFDDVEVNRYIMGLYAIAEDEAHNGYQFLAEDHRKQASELYMVLEKDGFYKDD